MAAAQFGSLKEEASCSICLDYFEDPVSIPCGHNFCRPCITYCLESSGELTCPHCRQVVRKGRLRPNWQLRNIVEKLKAQEALQCKEHRQALVLFCEEDESPVCVVCERSAQHRTHTVDLLEDAANAYKVKLQDWLCPLKKEMEYFMSLKLREEEKYETIMNSLRTRKQNIESEFEKMHQLLRENEQILHGKLEEMEKNVNMTSNGSIAKLSNEITSLDTLIKEIEKKCEEPAWELLKDARNTLNRCNSVKFWRPAQVIKNTNEKEKTVEIVKKQTSEQEIKSYKVMVTLDPDTAHPELVLSDNQRCVRETDTEQSLPDSAKRFTLHSCVLGTEGFTSGRYYWEVELLQEKGGWHVGVAAEFVNRKGDFTWSPEGGIWALRGCDGQYQALTSHEAPLLPRETPLKLGVYLAYEEGQLSLYNADSMELLYTYPQVSFTHRLFPYFYCWGGAELRLV